MMVARQKIGIRLSQYTFKRCNSGLDKGQYQLRHQLRAMGECSKSKNEFIQVAKRT
jgi:hypothetical protein